MAPTAPGVSAVTLRLPFAARCVARARRELVRDLAGRGLSRELVDDAVLVLSELVSNAVRYARPLAGQDRLQVGWAVLGPGTLRLEVVDGGGRTAPAVAHRGPGATGGRGLAIVDELTSAWGVTEDDHTSTVWAVLSSR